MSVSIRPVATFTRPLFSSGTEDKNVITISRNPSQTSTYDVQLITMNEKFALGAEGAFVQDYNTPVGKLSGRKEEPRNPIATISKGVSGILIKNEGKADGSVEVNSQVIAPNNQKKLSVDDTVVIISGSKRHCYRLTGNPDVLYFDKLETLMPKK